VSEDAANYGTVTILSSSGRAQPVEVPLNTDREREFNKLAAKPANGSAGVLSVP